MRIQSPLSNLCDVLARIKDSAKQYQVALRKNEAATRAVLIDPVLRALGWDTANTNMVVVESISAQVRADYALLNGNGSEQVIVEAKALGVTLADPKITMSLVSYAFQFQLSDVFLTDGLIWQHFDKFQPGQFGPSKTFDLQIDDPVDCAAYLVQHLDAALYWPVDPTLDALTQRLANAENDIATLRKSLAQLSVAPAASTPSALANTLAPATSPAGSVTLIDLDQVQGAGKKPKALRLPDSTVMPVNSWSDVLRECCKFALVVNARIPIPFSDKAGRSVFLIDTNKPALGINFVSQPYGSQTVFIRTNYNADACISNALHVLGQVPAAAASAKPAVAL